MTRQELLIQFIKDNGFRAVAEIGVAEGWTAEPVIGECDLDLYVMVEQSIAGCNEVLYDVMKRTDVLGDRDISEKPTALMRMDSVSAAKYISYGCLDLVYIDGDHSYDGVKNDIVSWLPKVRIGGILCGHDYDPTGDDEGLIRAVHEVLGDVELILDTGGGNNNHVWWVRVDAGLLTQVLPASVVASDTVTVKEPQAIDTFFAQYPLLQGFGNSWSWLDDVNHANPFYSPLYYILCRSTRAEHILEIGCEHGYSSYMLAMAAMENDGVYYCIEKSSTFASQLQAGLEQAGFPHVLIWADSKDITDFHWAPQLDFVLLDGEHSPEAIELEFDMIYPKLRPGSYIALHDIYAWSSEGFHTLVHNPEYNFEYITLPHNYGLALLRKREDDWDATLKMFASEDDNKEPGPGWMYTGKAPADGRVVVVSSTLPNIPVESPLHIPTEPPKSPDVFSRVEPRNVPPLEAATEETPFLEKSVGAKAMEAAQALVEESIEDGSTVIRIAASRTDAKAVPLEPVEPPNLDGVPENLKEYVLKLGLRSRHLDL